MLANELWIVLCMSPIPIGDATGINSSTLYLKLSDTQIAWATRLTGDEPMRVMDKYGMSKGIGLRVGKYDVASSVWGSVVKGVR